MKHRKQHRISLNNTKMAFLENFPIVKKVSIQYQLLKKGTYIQVEEKELWERGTDSLWGEKWLILSLDDKYKLIGSKVSECQRSMLNKQLLGDLMSIFPIFDSLKKYLFYYTPGLFLKQINSCPLICNVKTSP